MALGQRRLVVTAVAVFMSCGVVTSAQRPTMPDVRQRLESLGNGLGRDAFRIFPIEKPIWAEEWAKHPPAPGDIYRFVYVPRGRGLSFYVTFVLADSDERAHTIWQRAFVVQIAGIMSKAWGSDEFESWPSQRTGRWGHTVVMAGTDGSDATHEEWSSVMRTIDMVLLGKWVW